MNFLKKFQKCGMDLLCTTVIQIDENRSYQEMYNLLEMKTFRMIDNIIEKKMDLK